MIRQWLQQLKPERRASDAPEPSTEQPLLLLRNVTRTYHSGTSKIDALKDVSLTVEQGEFLAVLGKSGSGKSTLMNMITGVDHPTSGEVIIGGTLVHTLNEEQLTIWRGQHVGVVYQSFLLLPTLTVAENVMLPMDVNNTYAPAEFRQHALYLLDQMEMADHADKLPSAVSGGQAQRVAIARALANDPPLLVADEPTGSLDSKTANMVFQIFEELAAQGKTVIMVTHDRELARRAQRRLLLVDGQIMAPEAEDEHFGAEQPPAEAETEQTEAEAVAQPA